MSRVRAGSYKVAPFHAIKKNGTCEVRFRIVEAASGAVLDDAQGHGYETAQKAHAAWEFLLKNRHDRNRIRKHRCG